MNTEERTVVERDAAGEPVRVHREAVRETGGVQVIRESNSTAWWVAALVAVVAVLALLWLYNANQSAELADLEAAREAGRAEAMLDSAALQAQSAAIAAEQATRSATDSLARSTEQAAASAAAASEAAAREAQAAAASASDAAQDAAAQAPVVVEPTE